MKPWNPIEVRDDLQRRFYGWNKSRKYWWGTMEYLRLVGLGENPQYWNCDVVGPKHLADGYMNRLLPKEYLYANDKDHCMIMNAWETSLFRWLPTRVNTIHDVFGQFIQSIMFSKLNRAIAIEPILKNLKKGYQPPNLWGWYSTRINIINRANDAFAMADTMAPLYYTPELDAYGKLLAACGLPAREAHRGTNGYLLCQNPVDAFYWGNDRVASLEEPKSEIGTPLHHVTASYVPTNGRYWLPMPEYGFNRDAKPLPLTPRVYIASYAASRMQAEFTISNFNDKYGNRNINVVVYYPCAGADNIGEIGGNYTVPINNVGENFALPLHVVGWYATGEDMWAGMAIRAAITNSTMLIWDKKPSNYCKVPVMWLRENDHLNAALDEIDDGKLTEYIPPGLPWLIDYKILIYLMKFNGFKI